MAALQSIVTALPVLQQGLNIVSSARSNDTASRNAQASQEQAVQDLQTRQSEQERQLAQDATLERTRIAEATAQAEGDRKAALKRAVARQRARFGSSGITASSGGSAQAVLLGLFEESEDEKVQRDKLDSLRLGALDQNQDQQKRFNVIQRTQLQERQKINNASSFGLNSAINTATQIATGIGRLF